MGNCSKVITQQHQSFIEEQKIFFVATAPLNVGTHVNLSPKGGNCFRVLSQNKVAYLDMVGSGNETSAHLLENGRITFMFCAFDGKPLIMRLYGEGYTIIPEHEEWDEISKHFTLSLGTRQIIVANISEVQSSCGFSVPYFNYVGERDYAQKWADKKGEEGLKQYILQNNRVSKDGLPTLFY